MHLYGQPANMEAIMAIAKKHNLLVQRIMPRQSVPIISSQMVQRKTGTIGTIGCTSFFPSKNLGCYGDGGQYSQMMIR